MSNFRFVLGLWWKLYFFIAFLVSVVVLYPIYLVLLTQERLFPLGYKLIRLHAKTILFLVGIRLDIQWEENRINNFNETFVVTPNHTSYLDILMTYVISPHMLIFMGKAELGKVPIFNIFFKRMNILVNRGSIVGGHKAFQRADFELKHGKNVVIFPEGGILDIAPKLSRFKNGAFKLAIENNVPIIPITFLDNYRLLQDSFIGLSGPGRARVIVHKAIETKDLSQDDLVSLREGVFTLIDNTIKRNIKV